MRTFQFSDAKSHKFWNIDVQGKSFTVTYGKIGTVGQSQTKAFKDATTAQAEADKLLKEKTKKGYTETTPKAVTSEAEAFVKALVANPDDLTGWCAFADYLVEHDDPRGEFMQTQIALEDENRPKKDRDSFKKKESALLKKHEREWLGDLVPFTLDGPPEEYWVAGRKRGTRPPVTHSFARGWLNRVAFHNLTVNQARALTRNPGAKFVRELVVERVECEAPVGSKEQYIDSFYEPGPDVLADADPWSGPALDALCRYPYLAGVRTFQLGEGEPGLDAKQEEDDNCHTPGGLAYHLVKQMPHLEELYLLAHDVNGNKAFVLPMPKLRVLQLYHSTSYPLDKLAANKSLTNLTAILCQPHAMEYEDEEEGAYIRLEHLRAICRSPYLKNLTHLRLRLSNFGDKGAAEIASSGILKRLKVLDLQGGCMSDKGAKALAACPDLKNLEFLNLSRNAIKSEGTKAIKATGVKANLTQQHDMDDGEFGDGLPEYLFEGDIE
jgi:uncharacterized protein (TIGR02996 family)